MYEIGSAGETGGSITTSSATSTGGSSSSSSNRMTMAALLHSRPHVSNAMLKEITAALDSMPRVVKQSDTRELLESLANGTMAYWRDPDASDGKVGPVNRLLATPREDNLAIAAPGLDGTTILVSTLSKMLKLSLPTQGEKEIRRRFR